METINIKQLAVSCLLGQTGDEPTREQPCFVDCTYQYEYTGRSICYNEVADAIERHLRSHRHVMIETAVQHLVEDLKDRFPVAAVRIELKKITANKRCQHISAVGVWGT